MIYRSFVYEVSDGIARIRRNDPERLNALTFATYAELERVFAAPAKDSTVKVIVPTGTNKGFCSGGSVHEIIAKLIEMNAEEPQSFTKLTCDVVKNMRELNIAAVNGIAAGVVFALASDLRILSERARFAFLFTKAGLSGADMAPAICCRGSSARGERASELLFTGDAIDAAECWRIGPANRIVPHEKPIAETYEPARKLLEGPLEAMAVTKELLDRETAMDLN